MKLHTRLVVLVFAVAGGLGVAGCESLPADAPEHAALTRRYHQQTAGAVLATLDAAGDALLATLSAVRATTEEDWSASIAMARSAAERLRRAGAPADAEEAERWAETAERTRRRDAAALADRRAMAERSLAVLRADAAAHLEAVGDQLAVIEASLAAMGDAREARRRALGVELSRRLESAERRARAMAGRAGDAAERADRALRDLLDRPER